MAIGITPPSCTSAVIVAIVIRMLLPGNTLAQSQSTKPAQSFAPAALLRVEARSDYSRFGPHHGVETSLPMI